VANLTAKRFDGIQQDEQQKERMRLTQDVQTERDLEIRKFRKEKKTLDVRAREFYQEKKCVLRLSCSCWCCCCCCF